MDGMSARWGQAVSLSDHAELMVAWLRGEDEQIPCHCRPPDQETQEIVPQLVQINQHGLVTHNSQPARDGGEWEQRAYLDAYGPGELVRLVADAAGQAGLLVWVTDADGREAWPGAGWARVPVTRSPDGDCTWVGHAMTAGDALPRWDEVLSPAAAKVFFDAWFISIVDPDWGRPDLLWETVLGALR